jgi:hypothetical protein
MYSELRIHSGVTNHLFMPAGLQIDAIQGDLVEITASTSRAFPQGAKVPRLGLRKAIHKARLRGTTPRRVSWTVDGVEVTAVDGELPSPSILEQLPFVSFNGAWALRTARAEAKRRRDRR